MTDSIFTGILTLGLLIAGTAAIGSEVVRERQPVALVATASLPLVMVTGHRASNAAVVVASAR